MLGWFKQRATARTNAMQLYGSSVTQARHETFYEAWGVADTAEGRYEMIVLHLFALTERLKQEGVAGQRLSRAVLETFVTDMDDNMREMGVGDLAVPRRVKKAAAGLYERFGGYVAAMAAAGDEALSAALAQHVPGEAGCDVNVAALAGYMRRMQAVLADLATADVMAGKVRFPVPGDN